MPQSAPESKPGLSVAWMPWPLVCLVAGVVASSCNARPSCPPLLPPDPMSASRAPVVDPSEQPLPVRICDVEPDSPQCRGRSADEPLLLPRCRSDDPKCGPEFFEPTRYGSPPWPGLHGESGDQCYRPEAPRHSGQSAAPRDRCAWDGECRVLSCGLCVSYRRSTPLCSTQVRMDVGQPPMPVPPTWCGCVDGGCAFFRQ